MNTKIQDIMHAVNNCETVPRAGKVLQFYGLVVEASGPDVFLGEMCEIFSPSQVKPVLAEVVGFRDGKVLLMPYGNLHGIHVGSEIVAMGKSASITIGPEIVGRIVDAFGNPLDGQPGENKNNDESYKEHSYDQEYPLYPEPINPLSREQIIEPLDTGVKVIDSFLTTGKGQRMGLMAGSGVGKSTLLGMIAKNTSADISVIALIGERGREVLDFVRDCLGEEGLKKSVVIVATADQPALVRVHAAYVATAIAEYFMDQGKDVLLAMDSITRFAMAQREIGLAIGEPPTARGYTPSTFSSLPKLVERAGNFIGKGSITAFYTVLVEGDDFNEPVSDNLRAILDGHVVLTRQLSNQGQFPAVDLLQSISRLQSDLVDKEEKALVVEILRNLSLYKESKDMIDVGAYVAGQNPELDTAIAFDKEMRKFLNQAPDESYSRKESMKQLKQMVDALLKAQASEQQALAQKNRLQQGQLQQGQQGQQAQVLGQLPPQGQRPQGSVQPGLGQPRQGQSQQPGQRGGVSLGQVAVPRNGGLKP